ncbi:hypothetical protein Hs30E_19310 [Lactococcus hodotermopsidis]|uniref:Uncharacterized protein n=1 Tax=Pseudolactococcus hodotermopsidis TaxID=2709157 RepID=A0A6A0BD66_9LACT|nr:hypothetical protein [Lactococcus hodotermopsidis]GFH43380.1 hypothetical protein Hs30E_19310 [Lactococcus hodotermopsidis]
MLKDFMLVTSRKEKLIVLEIVIFLSELVVFYFIDALLVRILVTLVSFLVLLPISFNVGRLMKVSSESENVPKKV